MNILITGAAGFIGSQLAWFLHKKNYNLVLLDNLSYGHLDNLRFDDVDLRDNLLNVDIRDKDSIDDIIKSNQINCIYNIAGIAPLPDCQSNPIEAVDVNLTGFVNILESARINGVRSIIQASTNAIYENISTFPTKEHDFFPPSLVYPNSKYSAERFAQSYCDTYGMNVCCLRFSNVYGPNMDSLRLQPSLISYMIRELFYDRIPVFHSDGNQSRDYIYVTDLLNLCELVMNSTGFNVVNASSGKSYSVNDIYSIVKSIMMKDIVADYANDLHFWEKFPSLFDGYFRIKESILKHEINKQTLCDNSLAKTKYNWQPLVSMNEGLSMVIEKQCNFHKSENNPA
jgi:UDP-glucose 4-epimerase